MQKPGAIASRTAIIIGISLSKLKCFLVRHNSVAFNKNPESESAIMEFLSPRIIAMNGSDTRARPNPTAPCMKAAIKTINIKAIKPKKKFLRWCVKIE